MSVTTKALWAVQHLAELAAVGGYLYAPRIRAADADRLMADGSNSGPACLAATPPRCTIDEWVAAQAAAADRMAQVSMTVTILRWIALCCLLVRLYLRRCPAPRWSVPVAWLAAGMVFVVLIGQGVAQLGALSESDDQSYRTLLLIGVHLGLYVAGACAAWASWVLLSRSARHPDAVWNTPASPGT